MVVIIMRLKKGSEVKTNNKRSFVLLIILGILVVCLIVLIILVFNFKKEKDIIDNGTNKDNSGIIYNENEEVVEEKVLDGVMVKDIECSYDGFRSLLKYKIVNNSGSDILLDKYELVVMKNSDIVAIMTVSDDMVLKSGEEFETGNSIDIDLSDATAIKLTVNK